MVWEIRLSVGVIGKVGERQTSIGEMRDRKEQLKANAQVISENPW